MHYGTVCEQQGQNLTVKLKLACCVSGVLPGADAAVWPVPPASAGSQGSHGDETQWCAAQRHHIWLLQQGQSCEGYRSSGL